MSAQPLAKFIDLLASTPVAQVDPTVLDVEIERRLNIVRKQQGPYQPICGIDSDLESPRRDLLTQNCRLVEQHFNPVARKQQVRILDVGSNAGFVTLTLATTFPQIVGIDTNSAATALCSVLAQKMESPARFANIDFLDMIDDGGFDFENIDCVLLFNVVHQMIFARGLPYVQAALEKIVRSVDAVFVELATRDQYVPHKKDHLLPVEAEDVLATCADCDVELLRASPRPLYAIRRRSVPLAAGRFPFDGVQFSGNVNAYVSRKYYRNGTEFLKIYRFTPRQGPVAFHAEVRGLRALQGTDVCPEIIDCGKDEHIGFIRMGRIHGRTLSDEISRYDTKPKRDRIVAEVLRLAHALVRADLYQNDFSSHNMIVTSDGSLRLLDYEQTRPHPLYDPFAFLLWLISDLHTGRLKSYERQVFEKLVLAGAERADRAFYPDRNELADAGLNREFIDDAFSSTNWARFVEEWHPKFARLSESGTAKTR